MIGDVVRVPGCKKHRRYKAVLKPRVPCEACWRMWCARHPHEDQVYEVRLPTPTIGNIYDWARRGGTMAIEIPLAEVNGAITTLRVTRA